ncbi:MAG: methyltransferase domain-containing protein [Ilumatobacteraceae bacterium]
MWLTEALIADIALEPDAHVVDLGCGKTMSSIFLARELGVRVTAVDPWISASDNELRIAAAGLTGAVEAVYADARAFEPPSISADALVSVDAFHYFAQEAGAIDTLIGPVKKGGRIAIVVPGLRVDGWPAHLADHWQESFWTFKSVEWWERLFDDAAGLRLDGVAALDWGLNDDWIAWADACDEWARSVGREPYELEASMLRADTHRSLVFVMLTATRL